MYFQQRTRVELVLYLKDMQKQQFGLTFKKLRGLAYQLAWRNNCSHPFNKEIEMAGEYWAQSFMAHHSDLSLRKGVGHHEERAMAFNKIAVSQFFDLLIKVIDENKLTPKRIYNIDKSGVTVIPKQHSRVISMKGQGQVTVLPSVEHGNTVTVEVCCLVARSFMPLVLIFPRKRMNKEFELGLTTGSWTECNKTGWITREIFQGGSKYLSSCQLRKKNDSVLLLPCKKFELGRSCWD